MNRVITDPSYYNGSGIVNVALVTANEWNFNADADMKVGHELDASAQTEFDTTFKVSTTNTITSLYAQTICQKVSELVDNQENVVWHYQMMANLVVSQPDTIVFPYVCQNEDADADTTRFQVLQHLTDTHETAGTAFNMRADGAVVRRKQGISGAEDTNGLIFGICIWNPSGSAVTVYGIGHMSVHPNNYPLVCDQATV